jgi:acyl carrier protein
MDRKAILTDYIKNEIMRNGNAKLSDDEDLLSSGILDSLGILQLVAFIEKTFGIHIPDEDVIFDNFQSLSSISNYLDNAGSATKS